MNDPVRVTAHSPFSEVTQRLTSSSAAETHDGLRCSSLSLGHGALRNRGERGLPAPPGVPVLAFAATSATSGFSARLGPTSGPRSASVQDYKAVMG